MSGGPIQLSAEQEQNVKTWASDDRLWTTQETVEFNLRIFARVILALAPLSEQTATVNGTDDSKPAVKSHAAVQCPAGHGPMRYNIEDNRLHCHCGAVATDRGVLIVDPDPVETKARVCFIVGCGKQDINDPSGGTWPTCSQYPPACGFHIALVPPGQRKAQ